MTEITGPADYTWLKERYELLMQAYCVTLVRGFTAGELLEELKAEPTGRLTGVDLLSDPSYDASDHDGLFVGAARTAGR